MPRAALGERNWGDAEQGKGIAADVWLSSVAYEVAVQDEIGGKCGAN